MQHSETTLRSQFFRLSKYIAQLFYKTATGNYHFNKQTVTLNKKNIRGSSFIPNPQ
jgi:hypothetical protein